MKWVSRLGGVFLFAVGACQLVVGLERPGENDPFAPAPGDAGTDGPSTAIESGLPFLCESAFPAPPPKGSVVGADFTLAVRAFNYTTRDGGLAGIDLDCIHTCGPSAGEARACIPNDADGSTPADLCDEPGGIDNQLVRELLRQITPDLRGSNRQIDLGKYGQILRLKGYNGLPDDDEVGVALVPAAGFEQNKCDGGAPAADGGVPRWDGCDFWSLDQKFSAELTPNFRPGYVRGSVLYSKPQLDDGTNLGEIAIQLSAPIILRSAGVIAPLERLGADGKTPLTDGSIPAKALRVRDAVVFGRIRTSEVLDFSGRLRINDNVNCIRYDFWRRIQEKICAAPDLPSEPSKVGSRCDAFSAGVRFEAEPAKLGNSVTVAVSPRCVDDAPDGAVEDGGLFVCP